MGNIDPQKKLLLFRLGGEFTALESSIGEESNNEPRLNGDPFYGNNAEAAITMLQTETAAKEFDAKVRDIVAGRREPAVPSHDLTDAETDAIYQKIDADLKSNDTTDVKRSLGIMRKLLEYRQSGDELKAQKEKNKLGIIRNGVLNVLEKQGDWKKDFYLAAEKIVTSNTFITACEAVAQVRAERGMGGRD